MLVNHVTLSINNNVSSGFKYLKPLCSVILQRLGKNGREHEKATREHLAKYADAGLRTLVLAYRKLDTEEYNSWSEIFLKAKTHVGADRDTRLDETANLIEKDLVLVGATAVEDKLQEGVPQCINKLAQAGIKIWVLTGDKLETAVNIGFACSLLRQGMKQMIITLDDNIVNNAEASGNKHHIVKACRESIQHQLKAGQQHIRNAESSDSSFSLIIDGNALTYALEKDLEDRLLQLAVNCASVICCRVSPKQKALITRLVKRGTGKTTLGIGDGANDVGMIQEADIGVGISGVEGLQATMASDFAIAQFQFLERLLLVHGSWCYKRIALMICYFFYKNINFGFTLFYYEAFTVFSGQAAYNDWYMSLFNVFFTSLPVIALGVFEQDISASLKLEFPALYQEGLQNLLFGWDHILGWMMNGLCSSLITFFFVTSILQYQAFQKGGQVSGLEVLGVTLYTCVVWTVNCQIALAIKYFTWIQHMLIWGSICVWYLFLVTYGFIDPLTSTTGYQVFIESCAPAPMYWMTILLIVVAALLPYFTYSVFQGQFSPMDHHIIQENVYPEKDKDGVWLAQEKENVRRRSTIGLTARVDAKLKQLRESLHHNNHHHLNPLYNHHSEECYLSDKDMPFDFNKREIV